MIKLQTAKKAHLKRTKNQICMNVRIKVEVIKT